jgi:uncharacterized protein YbjT (DUF2867 family)
VSGPEVAVLAGRGKTGGAVCDALARRGARPRPLGREATAASDGVLAAALAGADALYLLAPNLHPDEPGYVARALAAAREAGVSRVVYHSVAAPYAPSMPHHLGKARAEDLVRRSDLRWTVLQPCAYVQNFLAGLRADPPGLRVPYDPRARFGLVDLRDVAEAAAAALLLEDHAGATYELGGPSLVSVADVAACAGAVLGRQVPVERVSTEQWRRTDGAGTDQREADWLGAMFDYYDRHGLPAGGRGLAALLGRGPTDLPATLARELQP